MHKLRHYYPCFVVFPTTRPPLFLTSHNFKIFLFGFCSTSVIPRIRLCSTTIPPLLEFFLYPCKTEHLQRSPLLSIGFNNFFYRGRATFFETFFSNFSAVSQKSTPVKCSVLPLLCYTGFRSSQGLSTNTLTTGVKQSR